MIFRVRHLLLTRPVRSAAMKSIVSLGSVLTFALLCCNTAQAQNSYSKTTELTRPVKWLKTELRFIGRQTDRILNDNGPVGHSISDTADSYGDLVDSQKKIIGRFDVITRATDVWSDGEVRMVMAEYNFGEGQDGFVIFGAGKFMAHTGRAELSKQHVFPVTGGKGRYLGATGQCTVMRIHAVDTHVHCVVYVPQFEGKAKR